MSAAAQGLDQLARDKKACSIPTEALVQYAKEQQAPTPALSRCDPLCGALCVQAHAA